MYSMEGMKKCPLDITSKLIGKKFTVLILRNMMSKPPVRIFFDNSTFLPSKVETIEDDPIHGDVLI
jgi:hypothetical protein